MHVHGSQSIQMFLLSTVPSNHPFQFLLVFSTFCYCPVFDPLLYGCIGKDIKRSESSSSDMPSEKTTDSNSTSETEDTEDSGVAERHYKSLDKEQRKTKPRSSVINKYLSLDFVTRRKLIRDTRKESRASKVLEMYPCFKDPNEVSTAICSSASLFNRYCAGAKVVLPLSFS